MERTRLGYARTLAREGVHCGPEGQSQISGDDRRGQGESGGTVLSAFRQRRLIPAHSRARSQRARMPHRRHWPRRFTDHLVEPSVPLDAISEVSPELADSSGPKIDRRQNSGSSGLLCFKQANTTTEMGNPSWM
jgi:hypothetical protein